MKALAGLIDRIIETDIFIIGSEGAGARAAIEANKYGVSITVATKGYLGKTGATVTGDADVDLDSKSAIELLGLKGNPNDSPEKFFEDMVRESKYISNQKLVEIHVNEAPARVKDLVDFGARINEIVHNPGHSYPRGAWLPGPQFVSALVKELSKCKVDKLEHTIVTDLLTEDGRVVGATALKFDTGEFMLIRAKAIIICAGGCLRIYPHTTAPDDLTGDGQVMAYLAGAKMIDMEFPMFLPYTLLYPPALDGIDFPFLVVNRLEAHALNKHGRRYMGRWDPVRMERSTRDINSIGIAMEVLEGRGSPRGGVYVSLKHLPANLIQNATTWFPANLRNWRYGGFKIEEFIPDFRENAMETGPACHFQNGGIQINEKCETNIPGLFAAGEGTGSIMGANRISGNALTMTQVWGARVGKFAAQFAKKEKFGRINPEMAKKIRDRVFAPLEKSRGVDVIELRKRLQKLAGEKVGVVRDKENLEEAIRKIDEIQRTEIPNLYAKTKSRIYNREWIETIQVPNMVQVLEMIAKASLMRTESRGALYRRDYPKTDNIKWLKNIVIQKVNDHMSLKTQPSVITKMKPPKGIFDYGFIEVKK